MEKLYKLTEEDINLIKNEIFHNYKSVIEKRNYEDIIINDRGQAVPASAVASAAGRQPNTNPSAVA